MRDHNIDSMRVAAAFAVVALHVSTHVISHEPSAQSYHWWIGNIYDSFTRWCVPIFVMISGAVLIRPQNGIPDAIKLYQSKISKIVIPLFFWSIFYLYFRHSNGEPLNQSTLFKNIIQGKPYYHLWYLYMLVGLYPFAPFISRLALALDENTLLLLIALCMFFSSASLVSVSSGGIFLGMFVPYIGYFLAGHWVHKYRPKIAPMTLALLFTAGGVTTAALTGALLPRYGANAWSVMYSNFSPFVALMAVSLFVFLIDRPRDSQALRRIASLAPYSFGIYLIHPFWMHVLESVWAERLLNTPQVMLPAASLLIFSTSLASIFLLTKIPLIRRCV